MLNRIFVCLSLFLSLAGILLGSPTSVYWTNCTTEFQKPDTVALNVTDYFSVVGSSHPNAMLPIDIGLLAGAQWQDLRVEYGVDFFGATANPWTFNAKIGIAENKLFCGAPALSVGVFNIGTRHRGYARTDQNVVDIVLGKTLPDSLWGANVYAGAYSGSRALGKDRKGYMVAMFKDFCPAKDCEGNDYKKWFLAADYASGNNAIGGGGIAVGYYFNSAIFIQSGPVWFNSAEINGRWKWGVQLYYTLPLGAPKKASKDTPDTSS